MSVAFSRSFLKKQQSQVEDTLIVTATTIGYDDDVPVQVTDLQTLLDEAVAHENAVGTVRAHIRAKYRTYQRLMMGCWKITEETAVATTVRTCADMTWVGDGSGRIDAVVKM